MESNEEIKRSVTSTTKEPAKGKWSIFIKLFHAIKSNFKVFFPSLTNVSIILKAKFSLLLLIRKIDANGSVYFRSVEFHPR